MTGMDLHLTDAERAGLIAVLKRAIADVTVTKSDGSMVLGPREGPLARRGR
jgi:hypothetical protein